MGQKLRGGFGTADEDSDDVKPFRVTPRKRKDRDCQTLAPVAEDRQSQIETVSQEILPILPDLVTTETEEVPTVTAETTTTIPPMEFAPDESLIGPTDPVPAGPRRPLNYRAKLSAKTVADLQLLAKVFVISCVIATVLACGWYFSSTGTAIGIALMLLVVSRGITTAVQTIFVTGVSLAIKIKVYTLIAGTLLTIGGLYASLGTEYFQLCTMVALSGILFLGVLAYTRAASVNLLADTD